MTTNSLNKLAKSLLKELPYFNFTGSLVMLHGQFNNSVQMSKPTHNNIVKVLPMKQSESKVIMNFELYRVLTYTPLFV